MQWMSLGLCEPGEASVRVQRATSTMFCRLTTAGFTCARAENVSTAPAPWYLGNATLQSAACQTVPKGGPCSLCAFRRICWVYGKLLFMGGKLSWKSFLSCSGIVLGEYQLNIVNFLGLIYRIAEVLLLERNLSLRGLASVPIFSWGNKSHSWGTSRKAKAQIELSLAKDVKSNKKCFYKYISD